ncbi:GspH/FimT family pseudopilin [Celerinatantimonas yamalensis]|uniref:GspH/FimT family protein n=1 Tax=Celerinatantimonas yamalensis TaxID=559956 RepID=A0ABW9GBB7_9GAMM
MITSLLTSFALGTDSQFFHQRQLQQAHQRLMDDLHWARLQAIQTQQTIKICSLDSHHQCDSHWQHIISIFIDSTPDPNQTPLKEITIPSAIELIDSRNYIHFNQQGMAYGTNQTLTLCSHHTGLKITISMTGNIHSSSTRVTCSKATAG